MYVLYIIIAWNFSQLTATLLTAYKSFAIGPTMKFEWKDWFILLENSWNVIDSHRCTPIIPCSTHFLMSIVKQLQPVTQTYALKKYWLLWLPMKSNFTSSSVKVSRLPFAYICFYCSRFLFYTNLFTNIRKNWHLAVVCVSAMFLRTLETTQRVIWCNPFRVSMIALVWKSFATPLVLTMEPHSEQR